MESAINIREVSPAESTALHELVVSTFVDSFGQKNTASDMRQYVDEKLNIQRIEKELANAESKFYYALEENEVVGYLKLNWGAAQTDDQAGSALEIERIYVKSDWQGKSIGQRMLDFTFDFARKNKFSTIWLGVWDQNLAAIRFYERHGFVQFGKHPFKLGNDDQTDLLMKIELSPVSKY